MLHQVLDLQTAQEGVSRLCTGFAFFGCQTQCLAAWFQQQTSQCPASCKKQPTKLNQWQVMFLPPLPLSIDLLVEQQRGCWTTV